MAKTILVTGASRGLGHAITKLLLSPQHSANVVLISRSGSPLEALAREYPGRVAYVAGSVTDEAARKAAVRVAVSRFGGLDGAVINHGVLEPVTKIADADAEAWRQAFDINVIGTVGLLKEIVPLLKRSSGRVLFISSGAAVSAYNGWGAYGASKAAMNHISMTLAMEEPEITSISLRPGVVDTQMQKEIREKHGMAMGEHHGKFIKLHNAGKLLDPEEPGAVAANLVMNAARELSGKFFTWNDENLENYQASIMQ